MHRLNIIELVKLIKSKKASPGEVFGYFQKRIKKYNPKLNAFLYISTNLPLKEVDLSLKLAGVPVTFKDMFQVKAYPATAASRVLEGYRSIYSSSVVDSILNEGALFIGKTNQDAWAHGSSGENSDFGPTKNPWDTARVPGGSSSGSAVAVAAGLVPLAFGTDTGGSVRLPACFTNTVAIKPTYSLVSRWGTIAMASSCDTMGHITKDVLSNAYALSITAGHDRKDGTSSKKPKIDYTLCLEKGVKGLKIGLPREYFIKGIDPRIEAKIKNAVKSLEQLGAEIREISLPHTEYALSVYYIIMTSEVSSNLARYDGIRYGRERDYFAQEAKRRIMLGTYTLSSGYYDAYYLKAAKVRSLIKRDFVEAFRKVDCIIAPVSPELPFKIGEKTKDPVRMYLSDIYTVTANLAGVPSLALPCGFEEGLPLGMQIIGNFFKEETIYRVAYAYEKINNWQKKEPVL